MRYRLTKIILLLFTIVCFGLIILGTFNSEKSYNENTLQRITENIRKAAMTCYSTEGYYPSSLTYLEEKYGLVIDHTKVNVFYETAGSNLSPTIHVTNRGAS